ncbi:MAG: cobalt-precorrin 5A hydrolase [Thermodesulfobacteriota bacterium]
MTGGTGQDRRGGRGGECGRGRRRVVIFAVTEGGERLAERIARGREGFEISRGGGGLRARVEEAFGGADALVFISATGIAVRMIAPLLQGKDRDPAVVVIDETGRFCVSLLSGHLGGANDLARELARAIGAAPVITTATDALGLPSAEEVASAFDLAIENVAAIKAVNSAIIRGGPVVVVDAHPARRGAMKRAFSPSGVFRFRKDFPPADAARACVLVSSSAEPGAPEGFGPKTLIMRPREFVIGLGCRRGVSVGDVERACDQALACLKVSPLSIRNLATIDIKGDEEGMAGFARARGLEIVFYRAEELNTAAAPSGASKKVREVTGARAVAEPAALLSAGAKRLWMRKKVLGPVTVAVARVPSRS